jgi:RND family efflux transporter MFP subunit
MGAPWTRDGTVRAYVVTMAPEVAGRIVKLPVADNQFVHKGDVLFEIDPADYRIALEQAQAQAQRDGAALDYARANEGRQAKLEGEGWVSKDIYQQVASTLHQLEAAVAVDRAAIAKAQLDLSRVVIRSPVNGYVTNLLAQLGDYATVGQKLISLVDADSFWVDGSERRKAENQLTRSNAACRRRPAAPPRWWRMPARSTRRPPYWRLPRRWRDAGSARSAGTWR